MGEMSQDRWDGKRAMMSVENDRGIRKEILVSGMGTPETKEILDIVERHQSRQRAMCRELEDVADSLPLDVDPSLCMRLARSLLPTLRSAHEFKEEYFCGLARQVLNDLGNLDAIIDRLRAEYQENELLAEEVAEELSQWGMCAEPKSAETVGYMLRGFFISMTRHLDFELVVLIDPIKIRLSRPEAAVYPEP